MLCQHVLFCTTCVNCMATTALKSGQIAHPPQTPPRLRLHQALRDQPKLTIFVMRLCNICPVLCKHWLWTWFVWDNIIIVNMVCLWWLWELNVTRTNTTLVASVIVIVGRWMWISKGVVGSKGWSILTWSWCEGIRWHRKRPWCWRSVQLLGNRR